MKQYFLLLVTGLLLLNFPAFSQKDTGTTKNGLDAFKEFQEANQALSDSLSKYQYETMKQKLMTDLAQERYFQKQYDFYFTQSLHHRFETFQWQQLSGKIIFWVVIIIVFIALLFAAIQFRISMQQAAMKKTKAKKAGEAEADTETAAVTAMPSSEVELSMKGVKVNSSVLGIVILVISLAFLYLYLVFVYPINTVKTEEFKTPETEQGE